MARVPMRIRMDLRTHWETTDSAAQKSILALKSLIGLPVSVILDPSILWSELHSYYPDPAIFIPSIISLVQVWADVLAARLEDEGNAKWTDLLLTHLMQRGSDLRVRVEAGGGTLVSTSLTRRNSNCVFLLVIPKVVPPYRSAAAYFATDLLNIFDIGTSGKEDEEAPASPALSRVKARVSASSEMNLATELPCVETLPRPEILFAQQLPYHMLVSVADNKIAVQGSHQKSLELLAEYMQRHVRGIENSSVKQPKVKVGLQVSHLGYGALFDAVMIVPNEQHFQFQQCANPILIIAFIEGVLLYRPYKEGWGENRWYFKREIGFS